LVIETGYILNKLQLIISLASTKPLLIKAIKIALIVGIILNLINQGDKIFILAFEEINYYKFFLTFIVPFSVSMYTAITMKLSFHVGEKAFQDTVLKCKNCNNYLEIKKDQTIPFCSICNEKTKWKIS
jgi:hypothetical protein